MTQYTNESISHAFFYKNDDLIKCNHLNLWKQYNVIYSYYTPIAILENDKNNNQILILSSNNMTSTTSKHLNYIRRAAPCDIIYYPFYYGNNFKNFDSLKNDLIENLDHYKDLNNVNDCKNFIAYFNVLQNLNEYFNLDFYIDVYNTTFLKANESLPAIKKSESLAKRQATIKFKKELKEKFDNFSVDDFLNNWFTKKELDFLKTQSIDIYNKFLNKYGYFDLIKKIYNHTFRYEINNILKACLKDSEYSYLYIEDDKIKTSRGITQKIDDIKPFFKLWKNGKLKHGLKIDCYTVLEVNQNYIKIGCHKIPVDNLNAVYNVLFN